MGSPRTLDSFEPGAIIYIAGPMSGYPDFNFPEFNRAARDLRKLGLVPVNPADKFGGAQWLDHTTYMRFSIAELLHCDGVYVLRGSGMSKGATAELVVAEALGFPVVWQEDKGGE